MVNITTGVIPPELIRVVIDQTAKYVTQKNNGKGKRRDKCEGKIRNSAKGKTPKFEFLQPTSSFHAYYEGRIQYFQNLLLLPPPPPPEQSKTTMIDNNTKSTTELLGVRASSSIFGVGKSREEVLQLRQQLKQQQLQQQQEATSTPMEMTTTTSDDDINNNNNSNNDSDIMSASDLVPRVVLFVTDLERENAALKLQLQEQESQFKEQEDKQLLVQITGPNRTPIYYESSLKHGGSGPAGWIHFDNEGNNNDNLLPLSLVIDSEVWLGGILIETFQDVTRLFSGNFGYGKRIEIYPEEFTDEENAFRTRGRSPVPCVSASIIGPMTDMEFSTLSGGLPLNLKEQHITTGRPKPVRGGGNRGRSGNNNLYLKIETIVFRKKNIRGAMSLLEKLEIYLTPEDDDYDSDSDYNDNDDDDDENENE